MLTINNTLDGYLKDVEILGNTIQDEEDLADIRSVGEKVEGQELYEIPVLSRGKNLFNKDGIKITSTNCSITNNGGVLTIQPSSYNGKNYAVCLDVDIKSGTYFYTGQASSATQFRNGGAMGEIVYNLGASTNRVINLTKDIDCIVLNYNAISSGVITFDLNSIQLEEGTVATPYEPYQEDKITILSPTPLEKVGDVADRIIEKDGVWGVEKNISEKTLSSNDVQIDNWRNDENSKSCLFKATDVKNINQHTINIICDKLQVVTYENLYNYGVGISTVGGYDFGVRVLNSVLGDKSLKQYIDDNNIKVKYQTTQPKFIPLPHDQQVKLRTFANKTNISFLTEIEGTIKAQVPKSLGATVNTHTTQISNLNKELDRVKKLEESTVSTVETESDFTTVEATSNGYFEDVKLEGKTLVNLYENKAKLFNASYIYSSNEVLDFSLLKPNSMYTLIVLGNDKVTQTSICNTSATQYFYIRKVGKITTFTTPSSFDSFTESIRVYAYSNSSNPFIEGDEQKIKFLILEGDHTQNPPSYFEGLKSVGQGADEIVVSSVNENLFNKDSVSSNVALAWGSGEVFSENNSYVSDYIKVNAGVYSLTNPQNTVQICAYDINKNALGFYKSETTITEIGISGTTNLTRFQVLDSRIAYIRLGIRQSKGIPLDINVFQLNKGATPIPYTSHQSDKKRLLFYNNETQTWEKPILREWDSIEKHTNGKYYYHVRSKEGDYVEGDESLNDCITDLTVSVKKLAEEKVYECTNIDLITHANETNYIVECGAISPKTTLKVHNNISNVVSLLQKKVSLLESNMTKYMITQNRMQLASTYSADSVTFKVDYALCSEEVEYNEDLYNLILNNILVGKDNYDYDKMFTMVLDYASWNQISWEQFDILVGLMDIQHNPPVEELPTEDIIEEDVIENETPVE